MCMLAHMPVPGRVVWLMKYLLPGCALGLIDRLFGCAGLHPCDWIMLARKPVTS